MPETNEKEENQDMGALQVQWDATDPFPRYLAYFMRNGSGVDPEQKVLFEDWIEEDELSETINEIMDNGYIIRFEPTDEYYTKKKIPNPNDGTPKPDPRHDKGVAKKNTGLARMNVR